MRKAAVVFGLTVFAAAGCLAFEIRGRVVTPEGKAVSGAVVLHRASGSRALTDAEGVFSLNLADEIRSALEITHPEFIERRIVVSMTKKVPDLLITLVPHIRQREEIVVTALRYPEASSDIPAAGTVLPEEALSENLPANITEGLTGVPGVDALGSGGFSLVPSVRGMARRRVLYLIDHARLSSERRTGPNASFVNPEDIEKIEVLRSPASVFYGSDAMGGVIHIFLKESGFRDAFKGKLAARFGTNGLEKGVGLSVEGSRGSTGYYVSLQGSSAKDYSSPRGKVFQSRYAQASLSGKIVHRTEEREIKAVFLGARGADIGKPNRDSLVKPTWYPKEDQNLFQFRWIEKKIAGGRLSFQAYINPNALETRTDRIDGFKRQESFSRTQSIEYGVQLSFGKKLTPAFRIEGGFDIFGQAGAGAVNTNTSYDAQGFVTDIFREEPYSGGGRTDAGFFMSGEYVGIRNLNIVGGFRWDRLFMKANPGGGESVKTQNGALSGFLAASFKISECFTAFANVSRAFRVPSLNERFYTGISGRGFIIAQPGLKPETSVNADGGIKYIGRQFFVAFYGFSYTIDDMIERYKTGETVYTYGNIEKGRIRGVEMEAEFFPAQGWKIFGHFFSIKGRSVKTRASLNDIPPLQIRTGTKIWLGRFSAEMAATFRLGKHDPGPAEITLLRSEIVDVKTSFRLNSTLSFYARLSNLFNKAYIARPDSEAVEEPGRSLNMGFAFSF